VTANSAAPVRQRARQSRIGRSHRIEGQAVASLLPRRLHNQRPGHEFRHRKSSRSSDRLPAAYRSRVSDSSIVGGRGAREREAVLRLRTALRHRSARFGDVRPIRYDLRTNSSLRPPSAQAVPGWAAHPGSGLPPPITLRENRISAVVQTAAFKVTARRPCRSSSDGSRSNKDRCRLW
jgi:hypothetical protein